MGVKRKIKRKAKVIELNRHRYLLFAHGIGALAENRNAALDELFLELLELSLGGLIVPVPGEGKPGISRVQFLVAKDMHDVCEFRKTNRQWEEVVDENPTEAFENLELVFPKIPERK